MSPISIAARGHTARQEAAVRGGRRVGVHPRLAKATTPQGGVHRSTHGAHRFSYPLDRGWAEDPDFEPNSHRACLHFAAPGDALRGELPRAAVRLELMAEELIMRGPATCPQCGGKTRPTLYGYPSRKVFEMAERWEVELGGCVTPVDQHETPHYCPACGRYVRPLEESA